MRATTEYWSSASLEARSLGEDPSRNPRKAESPHHRLVITRPHLPDIFVPHVVDARVVSAGYATYEVDAVSPRFGIASTAPGIGRRHAGYTQGHRVEPRSASWTSKQRPLQASAGALRAAHRAHEDTVREWRRGRTRPRRKRGCG